MNLTELAESDNSFLIEDTDSGFSVPMTLINDTGVKYFVNGLFFRVGVDIDPETGLTVTGDKTAVTIRLSSLPEFPEDDWIIEFKDITGELVRRRIFHTMLDRTTGKATMLLRR